MNIKNLLEYLDGNVNIKDLLEYLDGNGIVITDEDLVKNALSRINIPITSVVDNIIGRKVRLKGKTRIATIVSKYDHIKGGVRLDKKLDGLYSWNVLDLEFVS